MASTPSGWLSTPSPGRLIIVGLSAGGKPEYVEISYGFGQGRTLNIDGSPSFVLDLPFTVPDAGLAIPGGAVRKENRYYDLFPRIVRADRPTTIRIRPLYDHCRFVEGRAYRVSICPIAGSSNLGTDGQGIYQLECLAVHGVLQVSHIFEGEQEHVVLIEAADGGHTSPAELRVYSLADDLYGRRPYKGDLHVHSYRSDGWESPGYVAAASRRVGLDFMAVTDHRQYAPSLEAIRAFEGVPVGLRIYPGEEVHPPDCRVHIVNFGGRFSVNERFGNPQGYVGEVREIARSLPSLPPGVDRQQYAACVWSFRTIREADGLGVFCHPYWISGPHYDVPELLSLHILQEQPFDALELISGYSLFEIESNALQVARYQEERARGRSVPIVGASDAHGCERGDLFGWYFTIVFSPSPDLPDLVENIKGLYSVAVESLPGEMPRAYGPFRLVRYAHYLLREVFPLHDELCAHEGRLMLAHVAGDSQAVGVLAASTGGSEALYDHLWAPG